MAQATNINVNIDVNELIDQLLSNRLEKLNATKEEKGGNNTPAAGKSPKKESPEV